MSSQISPYHNAVAEISEKLSDLKSRAHPGFRFDCFYDWGVNPGVLYNSHEDNIKVWQFSDQERDQVARIYTFYPIVCKLSVTLEAMDSKRGKPYLDDFPVAFLVSFSGKVHPFGFFNSTRQYKRRLHMSGMAFSADEFVIVWEGALKSKVLRKDGQSDIDYAFRLLEQTLCERGMLYIPEISVAESGLTGTIATRQQSLLMRGLTFLGLGGDK